MAAILRSARSAALLSGRACLPCGGHFDEDLAHLLGVVLHQAEGLLQVLEGEAVGHEGRAWSGCRASRARPSGMRLRLLRLPMQVEFLERDVLHGDGGLPGGDAHLDDPAGAGHKPDGVFQGGGHSGGLDDQLRP